MCSSCADNGSPAALRLLPHGPCCRLLPAASPRRWLARQIVRKSDKLYLAERGVRTVGVDYLSVGGYKKDGAETHRALLGAGIWVIEGLNLSGVKPGRYDLVCLPLRIMDGDGAPARAVLRLRG